MPFKYRQRQIEQILFRNASISPQYFNLNITTLDRDTNVSSAITVEPSIVSVSLSRVTNLEPNIFKDD